MNFISLFKWGNSSETRTNGSSGVGEIKGNEDGISIYSPQSRKEFDINTLQETPLKHYIDQEVGNLKEKNNKLEKEKDSLKKELSKVEEDKKEIKEKNNKLEREIRGRNKKISLLKNELNKTTGQNFKLEK